MADDDQQWRTYQPSRRRADESAGEQATPEPLDPPVETIEAAEYLALVDRARKEVLGRVFKVALLVALTAIVIGVIRSLTAGIVDGSGVREAQAEQSVVMADFHDEFKKEFGDQVYELVLYADYAYVQVPVAGGDHRSIGYSWRPEGGFQEVSKSSGYAGAAWDIDGYDPALRATLCRKAERLIENAESCYLIIKAPLEVQDHWITVYASNDYSESSYLTADLDGTVLEKRRPGE